MTRLALVLNANARRLRRDPKLVARLVETAAPADVYVTRTLDELDESMETIVGRGTRTVVFCGGDGTFMTGLSGLARHAQNGELPRVAFAPAGTVATIARNFRQSMDPVQVVRKVCERPHQAGVRRPTLRVTERGGATRVGFIAGTGLVARFFDEYYAAGGKGYGTALRLALRLFAGSLADDSFAQSVLSPLPCELKVNGERLCPDAFSLVVCSTVLDVGLHVHVNYRAGEDPSRPHLVASPLPAGELGPQFTRVLRGRAIRGEGNFDDLVDSFTVTFPDKGPYVLDGDVFHTESFTVTAGPRVEVLRPKR